MATTLVTLRASGLEYANTRLVRPNPRQGANPEMVWASRPFYTRDDAASFEAALKALRQKQSTRFEEITGMDPVPFRHPAYAGAGNGCLLPLVATAGILAAFAWGLLSVF